jgi:Regulator of chromosome condensation (RCC1) repeat
MQRRTFLTLVSAPHAIMSSAPAHADGSGPQLASYYERHMALQGGVAWGWIGRGVPTRMRTGAIQLGVSQDAFFALLADGRLITWADAPDAAVTLMPGVAAFASGQSGWFAIDREHVLWQGGGTLPTPQRVADDVASACIGDSADYYIRRDGTLWVKGLAHRGQYGDGRLAATPGFVNTARDAVAVKAHTGHAIYLNRAGAVMGTGGNRFGPLGSHGLGDKADRWGQVFDGARAIATGSRHSLAIRADGSLWAWGEGFGIEPRALLDGATAVAAGNTATIALRADGSLLQWDGSAGPRRLSVQ